MKNILNIFKRKLPKYAIKVIGTDLYISKENVYITSDFVKTKSIYKAKDFNNWHVVQDVLDVIDPKRERYIVEVNK